MTLEKKIKAKYQETREIRDALQKEVDLQKVGEFEIAILEVFQETVRGKLIDKLYVSANHEKESKISLKNQKKTLIATDCKKSVAEKMHQLDAESITQNEMEYVREALKKYCEVISEDDYLVISLKD